MRPDDAPTMTNRQQVAAATAPPLLALSILWHPDLSRVGEVAILGPLHAAPPMSLSRGTPTFSSSLGLARPLFDTFVGREPCLHIGSHQLATLLEPTPSSRARSHSVEVDLEPLIQRRVLSEADLRRGVVVTLSRRIVLCLHLSASPNNPPPIAGLLGTSDAMVSLRNAVVAVADLDTPVFIRGETGTGKEVTASAIAQLSHRARAPFVPINMAAIPASTASAELFGHEKGAFTGASDVRRGYFSEADGGTIFLDEIGLTSPEIQAAILRVLETGETRPLGSRGPRRVNVRLIAATDAAPEGASLLPALYHRLSAFQIQIAPLRERREDIGILFLHFLRQILEQTGEISNLEPPPPTQPMWLSGDMVARVAMASWPGNVRQLKNFATQLVVANRGRGVVSALPELPTTLPSRLPVKLGIPEPAAPAPPATKLGPPSISPAQLIEALQRHHWKPSAAAKELQISRTTLDRLIESHPDLRKASDLSQTEISRVLQEHSGNVSTAAAALHISVRALQLRINARKSR